MKKLFYVLTAISLVAGVSAFAVEATKKIEPKIEKAEKKAEKKAGKAEETAMKMEEKAPAAMEGKASEETETPDVITEETATEGEKAMDAKAPSEE